MNKEIADKLRYGSPLHRKLQEALKNRLRMSDAKFRDRYKVMASNEDLFQAYIPEKEVDRVRRGLREKAGLADYRTIELPYAYSVLMTAHTYFCSVFLARSPILQLSGRHGESEQGTQGMEALLSYQITVGQNLIPLFIWLLDPGKYGFGVVGHFWDTERIRVRKAVEQKPDFFGMPIPFAKSKITSQVEDVIGYEGNRIYNVRPQDWFPDPRVALIHFQKGEFCARYTEISWSEIFAGSRPGNYRYFNYDWLRRQKAEREGQWQNQGIPTRDAGSGNVTVLPGVGNMESGYDVPVGFIKGHEVYLKLKPGEWGLGTEMEDEIWCFNITTNDCIFGAQPLGEYHGKFPFDLITDEIDGYSLYPRSTLERCKPLNDVMTWLINTHFYNVRATLNNQLIVDPSMVVMKDVERPGPGKIIRLKPTAYGKDVRMAVQQLQLMDITRGHVADLQLMMDMVQRMVPANDALMGLGNKGGSRETATSVRTSTNFAVSRLKTQCEWASALGFTPLTQKLVQRTQQNYETSKKLRIVGDLAQFGQQFLDVTPELIAGFYDYEPVDGTLPIDRFAQANLWKEIMGGMIKMPQVLMEYDIAKIFAWTATLGGIKNLTQFKLTPDDILRQQAKAGNVVPLSAVPGGKGAPPSGPPAGPGPQNLQEPKQVGGVGPTG